MPVIVDTGDGGVRVMCNSCATLGRPVRGRSWRDARNAVLTGPPGWLVGRGLSTDDTCPRCRSTPATVSLLSEILESA